MNYYQLLQISEDASLEVIKAAYKALTKKYHPDASGYDGTLMAEINVAYEVLSDEDKRKAYDRSLNGQSKRVNESAATKKDDKPNKQDYPTADKMIEFSYMGRSMRVDEKLAWRASIIEAGIAAGKEYIHNYKKIASDYNKVQRLAIQRLVRTDFVDLGYEMIKFHINSGISKGVAVVKDYGIKDEDELKEADLYILRYIKNSVARVDKFYRKAVNNSDSGELTDSELSTLAYLLYRCHLYIGRAVGKYLMEKRLQYLPTAPLDETIFIMECENEARGNKLLKGDMAVFEKLFELLFVLPDNIEAYCILYYLYGDPKKELEKIANFFGMTKEYYCCKEAFCENELRVDEEWLFSEDVKKDYTLIDWRVYAAYKPYIYECYKKLDVNNKETVDGFLWAAAKELRKYLYYSKEQLFQVSCQNEDDIFGTGYVILAAASLMSMYLYELKEEEFYEWASLNHNILKESLMEYYNEIEKDYIIPHKKAEEKRRKAEEERKKAEEEKEKAEKILEEKLEIAKKMKAPIDEAISNGDLDTVWQEVEKGCAYAEYALEEYYRKRCESAIDDYHVSTMETMLAPVIKKAKAGNLCAEYIFNYLTYKMYVTNRRNMPMAQAATKKILQIAEKGNILAIALKGFWGIKNYYNATSDKQEGVYYLQIAADKYNPTALAHLGACYRTGDVVGEKDLNKARECLELAAFLGHLVGIEELGKLNKGNTSSSSCFITTAVCESFGKPDDCYELESFRDFRDKWLVNQTDGKELVAEYYEVAPKIVKRIDACTECNDIYERIWNDYLCDCLRYIEDQKYDECKKMYMKMVNALKKEYLS